MVRLCSPQVPDPCAGLWAAVSRPWRVAMMFLLFDLQVRIGRTEPRLATHAYRRRIPIMKMLSLLIAAIGIGRTVFAESPVVADGFDRGLGFHSLGIRRSGAVWLADLELTGFGRRSGDSETRLVLRGVRVKVDQGTSPWRIRSVSGGVFHGQQCRAGKCTERSAVPWTIGPFQVEIPVKGLSLSPSGGLHSSALRILIDDAPVPRSSPEAAVPDRMVGVGDLGDEDEFSAFAGGGALMPLSPRSRPAASHPKARPRRAVSSGAATFDDHGLRGPLVISGKVLLRNIVGNGPGEAFSVESCRTSVVPAGDSLRITTAGCSDGAGPLLLFDVVLETLGPDSWMGSMRDTLPAPYHLSWSAGRYVVAEKASIRRSSPCHFGGASLWGYEVRAYDFDSTGVVLRDFDLVLPGGNVFPWVGGRAQVIRGFAGARIRSIGSVMDGQPTISGKAVSRDTTPLVFDSNKVLCGQNGWEYQDYVHYGYSLKPVSEGGHVVAQLPQPPGLRFTKIGSEPQTASALRIPIPSIVFGPGEYAFAADSQPFEMRSGRGIRFSGKLHLAASDDEFMVSTDSVAAVLDSFFSTADSDLPGAFVTAPVENVKLSLKRDFSLDQVSGEGAFPNDSSDGRNAFNFIPSKRPRVYVGGCPWIFFQGPRFQLMRGRDGVGVRLVRESSTKMVMATAHWWPHPDSGMQAEYSRYVYCASFDGDRNPIPAAATLEFPDFAIPGFPELTLLGGHLDYEADMKGDTMHVTAEGPSTVRYGKLFDKIGIATWALPATRIACELFPDSSVAGRFRFVKRLTELKAGGLGIPLELNFTKSRLRKWYGQPPVAEAVDTTLWSFYTGGQSIDLALRGDTAIDVGIRSGGISSWSLLMGEFFPVQSALQGMFHLDSAILRYDRSGALRFTAFRVSGTKTYDTFFIRPGLELLPSPGKKVVLDMRPDRTVGQEVIACLAVSGIDRIRLDGKVFQVPCRLQNGVLRFRLDGHPEGLSCGDDGRPTVLNAALRRTLGIP